jgi:RNA polymerase sigma factor (sigma-70 family)
MGTALAVAERPADFDRELLAALPSLRRSLLGLTRNAVVAEDLVQETTAKAMAHATSFRPGTNMGGWLYTIARNAYYAAARRAWRTVEDPEGIHEASLSAPASQEDTLRLREVLEAIDMLPRHMRKAIRLMGLYGHSIAETAEMLGIPEGTVKSQVSRARALLSDDQFAARLRAIAPKEEDEMSLLPMPTGPELPPIPKAKNYQPSARGVRGGGKPTFDKEEIIRLVKEGKSVNEVAAAVGCSRSLVYLVKTEARAAGELPEMKTGQRPKAMAAEPRQAPTTPGLGELRRSVEARSAAVAPEAKVPATPPSSTSPIGAALAVLRAEYDRIGKAIAALEALA